MKAYRIATENFQIKEVYECTISKMINDHPKATIVGLTEQSEDELVRDLKTKSVESIYAYGEKGEKTLLFTGVVFQSSVKVTGNLRLVSLTLISRTYMADLRTHSRSYQNESLTFSSIIRETLSKYGQQTDLSLCDSKIGKIIVQYKETDWEFLKRIASYMQYCVIPLCNNKEMGIQIGITGGNPRTINDSSMYEMQRVTDINVDNALVYRVESREIFEMGEPVKFQGKNLYVYAVEGYYKGEEYVATYELREREGFRIKKYRNMKFVGAALDGTVAEVKADMVTVNLGVDFPYGTKAEKFFPYASVYSSPDGTGWYCMPEVGDAIRLFFPSEKEEDAYVINAVHVSEGADASQYRSNPDDKILMNSQKKMVKLTPTNIVITNNDGLSITLDDEKGITINSDKDIKFEAKNDISLISKAGGIDSISVGLLHFCRGESVIDVQDDINIKANDMYIQQ